VSRAIKIKRGLRSQTGGKKDIFPVSRCTLPTVVKAWLLIAFN